MIIGISGKIGSGKDTVGKMIQYWDTIKQMKEEDKDFEKYYKEAYNFTIGSLASFQDFCYCDGELRSDFEIKKFAYKIKQMVALLIGCTVDQLEDQDFKAQELGREWWYWIDTEGKIRGSVSEIGMFHQLNWKLVKPTPRLLLQLMGTECGRNILHPQVWVNALFADYKNSHHDENHCSGGVERHKADCLPKWIITDTRFPNEAEAVKQHGGIIIRITRHPINGIPNGKGILNNMKAHEHPSETALDDYKGFDHIIDNNGTMEELLTKVETILKHHKLL